MSQSASVTRRSFLRISGAAAAGLALAACAPAAPSPAGGAESAQPAAEPVQLSLSVVDYVDETRTLLSDAVLPAFSEAHPGATVSVNYTNWERYNEEMTTAFAGGVTPDIFQGGAVWSPQMAQRGWCLPLDDLLANASESWNWDDFFPALQDDSTINGQIVSIPYRIDIRSFWYRKDHLEEAGFSEPPTNWEELEAMAVACTKREGDQITREGYHYSSPGGWQNDLQAYMPFMEMAGGQFLSDDLSHCTLAEDPAVEALEFIHKLIVDLKVQPYPGFEAQGDLGPLEAGIAAATIGGAQIERNARTYAPDQLDHLWPTLPLTHKVQATHVWVNKYFISKLTKNPEVSWQLLETLTSADVLSDYCEGAAFTPPRRSLGEAEFMTERAKTLLDSTEYAVPFPKHHRLIELFRPLATNLEKCYRQELSPADAMAATAAEVDALLQESA